MNIYLIRHTTPLVEKGICYGQTDLLLDSASSEEFEVLHKKLPAPLEVIFCSPLKRCVQLAEFLSPKKTIYDARLQEMNFGDWEMQPWQGLASEEFNKWMADFVHQSPPGGETFKEVSQRVEAFWQELNQQTYEQVGIVAHGGTIRALACLLLEIPLQNAFKMEIEYGNTALIEHNYSFTKLKYWNL